MTLDVIAYVDGACSGNPGPGGWGVVLLGKDERELSGGDPFTTNNRMEITAAIRALSALSVPSKVLVRTDSQYLVGTMAQGWKRKSNLDLWAELDRLCRVHSVTWEWVRGHSGDVYNERADQLACSAIQRAKGGAGYAAR